nr:hypothetical protein [Mucilaginibacter sp. X4EP1]
MLFSKRYRLFYKIDERLIFIGKDGVFIGENNHHSVIITLSIFHFRALLAS